MKNRKLVIGLIGLGTVGASVVEILRKRRAGFLKGGYDFAFKILCDRDTGKKLQPKLKKEIFTTEPSAILNDPDINVVIELIGGDIPARGILLEAINRGKNVITANKRIVSEIGDVLARKARDKNCYFGFRATLTGCHVIMDQLVHGGPIRSVAGVFNGTSNYVLTRMKELDAEQQQAVQEAQRLGYAERNPSEDIDGIDTAYKLKILSMLVFGFKPGGKMLVEGIRRVTPQDLRFAGELGYEIRLLGIARKLGSEMDVRVHPALVSHNSKFALIRGAENCVEIDDVLRGVGGAMYEGAGGYPAASAVVQDLIDVADGSPVNWPSYSRYGEKLNLMSRDNIKSKYYLLFKARNKPGVLAGIASALAENGINIEKVEQKGEEEKGSVPVVLITDEAVERDIHRALKKIYSLEIIRGAPKFIRFWQTSRVS